MLSRLLGFVRDIVFANVFGAGPATDAFLVAFKIPNFLRRLFAEGAFSQAFVPVLSEYKAQREHGAVQVLVGDVAGALGSVLLPLTVLGVIGSPLLVMVFAPGFTGSETKFGLAADMLRITFPYLFFISLTAMAGGVLNTYGKFAVPAFTPVWLNISLIGAAVWGAVYMEPPIMALAWGVFAAGIVQLIYQFPSLARLGLLSRPRWGWHDEAVRRIIKLMLPAIFGSSVAQINLLLDTVIASFLVSGSVSWLYYSDRLMEFPLGVFGIALATVILPGLSEKHAKSDPDAFTAMLDWALRWVLLIGVPAALGLIFLAAPLLATLFRHGAFQAADVRMASLSLMAYGAGLVGFMMVKVLAPGFYARHDTRTPVRIGIYAMAGNMLMNLVFVVPMVLAGLPGPHAGLALATSVAAFLNAGLLFRRLRAEGAYRAEPGWGSFLGRIAVANGVMCAVLYWGSGSLNDWLVSGSAERAARLAALIVAGGVVYFGSLWLLGMRPRELMARRQ